MDGKKVLMIDDDSRNLFALKAVLKAKGYTPLTALDVKEGLALLESDPGIGVVLLDMMMPEIDGYEALQLIRHHPTLSPLPVIAVTAQAMVGDREKCLEAGADDYISKPIDVDTLMRQLQRYIK